MLGSNSLRRWSSGFTLVELLVVIGIVAVLIAILLPALGRARERANRVVCASNMRQLYLAFQMYENSYKQLPPGDWGAPYLVKGEAHPMLWERYGVKQPLTICPSAADYPNAYFVWGDANQSRGRLSYYYLGGYGGAVTGPESAHPGGWYVSNWYFYLYDRGYYPRVKIAGTKNSTSVAMFLDLSYLKKIVPSYGNKPLRSNHQASQTPYAAGQNVCFYDGHVDWQIMNGGGGKPWRLGADYYDNIWWNPNFPAPPNAEY